MMLWDVSVSEEGHLKAFYHKEVDDKFIEEHPHIPRIWYDRHSVVGWESNYMNPDYRCQFFLDSKDIYKILGKVAEMWSKANRYGLEIEGMRLYLSEMEHNPNAAHFLKQEALRRWDWLRDTDNLEEDIVGWEQRVEEALTKWKKK